MRKLTSTFLLASTALVALPVMAAAQTVEADKVISLDEWSAGEAYGQGVSVEQFIDDTDVYDLNGEEIGDVENVIFGPDGIVKSVIIEVGGFLDLGDTHLNVPWSDVQMATAVDGIMVPVTEDNVEDYSLFATEVLTTGAVGTLQEVDDDLVSGPDLWRATELLDDYARIMNGESFTNYGYVDDILMQDGKITAVVVNADVMAARPGYYAFPYYGTTYGWDAGDPYYDMPYAAGDIEQMQPFEATSNLPQDMRREEPAD